ncbi:hypothetical protein EVAR_3714_1 [Eumeta japonica]|uniref:Uncharacterized protein n=1 Tax=Eumeta variegata TaxID=151549 RepID=A0A4C1SRJ6_EUMVA|nr:hypothetical protein EVAR_3714_1 [Eumeta japonica]
MRQSRGGGYCSMFLYPKILNGGRVRVCSCELAVPRLQLRSRAPTPIGCSTSTTFDGCFIREYPPLFCILKIEHWRDFETRKCTSCSWPARFIASYGATPSNRRCDLVVAGAPSVCVRAAAVCGVATGAHAHARRIVFIVGTKLEGRR